MELAATAEVVPEPLGPACGAPLAPAAAGVAGVAVVGVPTAAAAAAGAEASQAATGGDADRDDAGMRSRAADPGVTGLTAV